MQSRGMSLTTRVRCWERTTGDLQGLRHHPRAFPTHRSPVARQPAHAGHGTAGLQGPGCRGRAAGAGPPPCAAPCPGWARPPPASMAGFADLNLPQGADKKSLQSLLEAAAHRES